MVAVIKSVPVELEAAALPQVHRHRARQVPLLALLQARRPVLLAARQEQISMHWASRIIIAVVTATGLSAALMLME